MWDDNSRNGCWWQDVGFGLVSANKSTYFSTILYTYLIMLKLKIERAITLLQGSAWYAFGLVCLAITSLMLLGYEASTYAKPEIAAITIRLDLLIASIFMCDFWLGYFFNKKYTHGEYWRKNWLDFIASIPLTADMARMLRIFRVWRALRVIGASADFYFARRRYRSIKQHRSE
jgi:ABC-type transport system involved in multi-copper enzyme maturation permease subunit